MATRVDLPLGDTVAVDNSGLLGGDSATIVGTGPIWKDDSDATYADIVTQMHGAGQPQFASTASVSVAAETITADPAVAQLIARLRLASSSADMPIPTTRLYRVGQTAINGSLAGTCPTSPTWVEIPFAPESLNSFFDSPSAFSFNVLSPFKSGETGDRHWQVYEAQLILIRPSDDAPPCRIFPRSDGLGVGAGRNYPPPKSQQRSSRGVGYY